MNNSAPHNEMHPATRYGNVMASRGSVIPLIVKQIKEGKPLTVTDPEMTRFLMSLDDSLDLVLHAFGHGCQGDIFVQKAPASTVKDIASALKEIFTASSEIKIIGTRHGEKLYETLLNREETEPGSAILPPFRVTATRTSDAALFRLSDKHSISNATPPAA